MQIKNISNLYSSKINDLFILKPEVFYDFRGENFEGFQDEFYQKTFSESLLREEESPKFIIDSYSKSSKNVLRGFHGDNKTWKLIQCLAGSIYFVVIDARKDSPTVGSYQAFNLNDKERVQVLVPKGCVNAHLCLSDECLFQYKLTSEYVSQIDQIHVKWNDPQYNVFWPILNPILSERDS